MPNDRPTSRRLILAALAAITLPACSSTGGGENDRGMIGRGIDSLGGLIGRDRSARNAELVSTGTDAVAAAEANPYMDQQEADFRKLEARGVKVTRAGNQLVLSIPSGDAFDANRDQLTRSGQPLVGELSSTLKKYDRTTVDVYGHTDAGGDEKKNLDLTQRRALAIARYMAGQGVDAKRLSVTGFGSARPVGSNDTEAGRVGNRRIEIQISPVTKS